MQKESEFLELKKSTAQLKEGIISLSAMLNKNNKGELLFGINDEGITCGINIGRNTMSDIAHEIRNNLKPLPTTLEIKEIKLDEHQEENKSIIRIYVEGFDTPYSAYGRYYMRLNDSDIFMDSNILENFFLNKIENNANWEKKATNYTIDDVDEDLLIQFIRDANDYHRLDYVYKNKKETLEKLGLLCPNDKINNACNYLFGKNKPITIKLGHFATDSRLEFGEIKEFRGNIFECIEQAIKYICDNITYKADIISIQRIERPEIPIRAIREIVINSLIHSNYMIKNDFHQFIIYRSRVEIYNPGGLYKNIDPAKFASGEIGSKPRNVLITSILYIRGFIEAFGTGFHRTFQLCKNENINYHYVNDEFGFKFVFERKINFLSENFEENIYDPYGLDDIDKEIIKEIKITRTITIPELSEKINKSVATIYRHLEKLMDKNLVVRVGSKKKGYWKIN